MGGIPKSVLLAVAFVLALCAGGGFALGLMSTASRKVAGAADEEAPIAGALPAGATIKDAQPLVAPPPPPPPVAKPKAPPVDDAASDLPPTAAQPVSPPAESAPSAPPSLAVPPPAKPAAPLPADLPPT
jgi:hypothetical protein